MLLKLEETCGLQLTLTRFTKKFVNANVEPATIMRIPKNHCMPDLENE
jgi:hypothetical protein